MKRVAIFYSELADAWKFFIISLFAALFFWCVILSLFGDWRGTEIAQLVVYILSAGACFFILLLTDGVFKIIKERMPVVTVAKHLAIAELTYELKLKSKWMRRTGHFLLFLICLCLLGGAYFFGQAESRASNAANSIEVKVATAALEGAQNELAFARKKYEGAEFALRESDNRADVEFRTRKKAEAFASLQTSESAVAKRQDILDRVSLSAKTLEGESLVIYLTSVLSTKIGIVLFLLFLVQILVGLHRYLMRLAAFYDSRAYMMQLVCNVDKLTISETKEVFLSDAIDFGKQPKPPAETVAESVTGIVKNVIKRKPATKPKTKPSEE